MEVSVRLHAPAVYPWGEIAAGTHYIGRRFGLQSRYGCCGEILSLSGIEPRPAGQQLFTGSSLEIISPTVAARSKAWTVFARLNTGIVGSNPIRSMDVSVRLICVLVLCVGSGLTTADPPSKESYWLCIDKEIENATKVERAVEP
jgi:hypothetical protein